MRKSLLIIQQEELFEPLFKEEKIMEGQKHNPSKLHWIKIIHDPNLDYEKHKHVVQPGHQYVSRGDEIRFRTKNTTATVFIPKAMELFNLKTQWINVDQNGHTETLIVQNCNLGKYAYAAYCDIGEDFAEGGTSPAVIVED